MTKVNLAEDKTFTLVWRDHAGQGKMLTEENKDEEDLVNLRNPAPIQSHRQMHRLKSGVKGRGMIVANPEQQNPVMQVQV